MTRSTVVLTNLADLAQFLDALPQPDQPTETDDPQSKDITADSRLSDAVPETPEQAVDLPTLLADLDTASSRLQRVIQRDGDARTVARQQLDAYDALLQERRNVEEALERARRIRQDAELLTTTGFTEEARVSASAVVMTAARAEHEATQLLTARDNDVQSLANQPALQRLLEERRRQEERQEAAAAEAARTRQFHDRVDAARAALSAGHVWEADRLIAALAQDHPASSEVAALQESRDDQLRAARITHAEATMRAARSAYRDTPAEAVSLLEGLDLRDLPHSLARQVKGIWAAACARLCRERGATTPLLRYLPAPAHGVVVAREEAGGYRVISALVARDWSAGTPVPETFLRHARPLRASGQ